MGNDEAVMVLAFIVHWTSGEVGASPLRPRVVVCVRHEERADMKKIEDN